MKKKLPDRRCPDTVFKKMFLVMRLTFFFIFLFTITASASALSQKVSLDVKSESLNDVLGSIRNQAGVQMLYDARAVRNITCREIRMADVPVSEALDNVLRGTGFEYADIDGVIVIRRTAQQHPPAQPVNITGRVTGEKGEPLLGVNVTIKGRPGGTSTDLDGSFKIQVANPTGAVIVFSFIGKESVEIPYSGQQVLQVTMKESATEIGGVMVQTGIFQRNKMSFTGSATTFSGEELLQVGNMNILHSLATLDPSFVILDNIEWGSNPNVMPSFEMRGQTGATLNYIQDEFSRDPNQPLFVLNGVEVSISNIVDLDPNRILSITLLKDAGSTAIYGSKGANGVVVVETVKPQAGEYRVYYNADLQIEAPDLSVYNMMNSAEKLEFERLAGKYLYNQNSSLQSSALTQIELNKLYNHFYNEILSGVDTYWLSEPVRTGFTHAHSVRVSGGSEALAVDVGAKYKDRQGAMKGSQRRTWEGNVNLVYRAGKFIISNDLAISGYNADESNYGNFADWVNASPYYRKRDGDGTVHKWLMTQYGLGSYGGYSSVTKDVPNPLYNAGLNSKDHSQQFYVRNSFYAQYDPSDLFQFKTGVDLTRTNNQATSFTPPEHTKYHTVEERYRGEYSNSNQTNWTYKIYVNGLWGQTFNRHSFTLNARAELGQESYNSILIVAEGFPLGSSGAPNLAETYKRESKPGFATKTHREVSALASLNYNYDLRYLFDFSFRTDGATTFGSNKLFQPFWSTGIGWNINREAFASGWDTIEILKLRASTGTTGNQNIGQVYSQSIYNLFLNSNVFGQGAYISNLGTPDLPWQVTRKHVAGLDFRMRDGRVSFNVDVYKHISDPLIIHASQVPSTGLGTYPIHVGRMTTQGVDWILSVAPIVDRQREIHWSVRITGAHTSSKYSGFRTLLDGMNEELSQTNTMRQFRDGHSPNDIWAVRSYGIDPATGSEVYIKRDGTLTYTYDAGDQVVVGSEAPDINGVIGTNFRWKNLQVSVGIRYTIGGYIYNSALYNKVENITQSALENNQDKRALYDRWKNVGDRARFQGIAIVRDISPRTSRFVQKNNFLRGENISVSYQLVNNPWLIRNLNIRSLKVSLYTNDFFRLESSKYERGINYPFARSYSMAINLSF